MFFMSIEKQKLKFKSKIFILLGKNIIKIEKKLTYLSLFSFIVESKEFF
jgi:hypothetical protein